MSSQRMRRVVGRDGRKNVSPHPGVLSSQPLFASRPIGVQQLVRAEASPRSADVLPDLKNNYEDLIEEQTSCHFPRKKMTDPFLPHPDS
jgi:hypothetical protein